MATIAKKDNLTEALETKLHGDVLDADHPGSTSVRARTTAIESRIRAEGPTVCPTLTGSPKRRWLHSAVFPNPGLRGRSALSSAAPGQHVPDNESYCDYRRRNGNHGNRRSGHDHTVVVSHTPTVKRSPLSQADLSRWPANRKM